MQVAGSTVIPAYDSEEDDRSRRRDEQPATRLPKAHLNHSNPIRYLPMQPIRRAGLQTFGGQQGVMVS